MKRNKRLRLDSNLSELRKSKLLFGLEVWQFSDIHYRIIGERTVDYWPTRGTAWLVGSHERGRKMSPTEICDLARGITEIPTDLVKSELDRKFRVIIE
jgi:hypothetical protein